jgi:hypothetical protein
VEGFLTLPAWLGTALVGAALAALGYVAKLLLDSWGGIRSARANRHARLVELSSLLRATRTTYLVQCGHRDRLADLLLQSHPDANLERRGYDHLFATLYGSMSPEELALHSIIRAMTQHAMRPLNDSLREWLKRDVDFKGAPDHGFPGELARSLGDLEAHLILWDAKYRTWIPRRPQHALVYLADEEKHGVGFPRRIEELVERARARWW